MLATNEKLSKWRNDNIWRIYLTSDLEGDIDLDMSQLKMYKFMRCTCMPNIKWQIDLHVCIWPLTWKGYLDLNMSSSKCMTWWDSHARQISSLYLYWFKSVIWSIYLKFGWHWPWYVTPLRCVASWDTHACQISSVYLYWFKSYG